MSEGLECMRYPRKGRPDSSRYYAKKHKQQLRLADEDANYCTCPTWKCGFKKKCAECQDVFCCKHDENQIICQSCSFRCDACGKNCKDKKECTVCGNFFCGWRVYVNVCHDCEHDKFENSDDEYNAMSYRAELHY